MCAHHIGKVRNTKKKSVVDVQHFRQDCDDGDAPLRSRSLSTKYRRTKYEYQFLRVTIPQSADLICRIALGKSGGFNVGGALAGGRSPRNKEPKCGAAPTLISGSREPKAESWQLAAVFPKTNAARASHPDRIV
jgi:hypothetical protein